MSSVPATVKYRPPSTSIIVPITSHLSITRSSSRHLHQKEMNYCSRRSARHHAGSPSNGLLSWIAILMTVNILSCHHFDCNAADHNIHHTAHHASVSPSHASLSHALVDRQRRWITLPFFSRKTSIIQGHFHFVGSPHYLNLRGGHAPSYSSSSSNGEVTKKQQQQTQTAASSTSNRQQSPFEYIPITALDDYGQSTQLRHAMESANRFGTPVLACICCTTGTGTDDNDDSTNTNDNDGLVENAIVVCSLQRPRPGVISPTHTTTSSSSSSSTSGGIININSNHNKHHPSIQGMVRLLATRDDIHEHDKDAS